MKYLLIILFFVSSFCYGQNNRRAIMDLSNHFELCHGCADNSQIQPAFKLLLNDSNVLKYDTSFGIVETYLRDGSFLRGWGFVIDSLEIIPQMFSRLTSENNSLVRHTDYDTVRFSIKVFSQPLACYIDTKKYYKFIPIKHLQNMELYEDEHISISPNENYKKDEK